MTVNVVKSDNIVISTRADVFWLNLGHLRAIVAAADRNEVSDNADVLFEGLKQSAVDGQWWAQRITVEYVDVRDRQ